MSPTTKMEEKGAKSSIVERDQVHMVLSNLQQFVFGYSPTVAESGVPTEELPSWPACVCRSALLHFTTVEANLSPTRCP